MTLKVVQISDFGSIVPRVFRENFKLPEIDFSVQYCTTGKDVIAKARDADIIALTPSMPPLDRETIEAMPNLRYIVGLVIGYNGLDVKAATDNGILFSNMGDICWEEMSDTTMALILAWTRRIVELNAAVKNGEWTPDRYHERIGREIETKLERLQGKTLGLVGFGGIARSVAQKARAFGMRIIATDPFITPGIFNLFKTEQADLNTLLKESDIVSVHTYLSKETENLIGLAQLKMMKPTAIIVNTARGPIINHEALYTALTKGIIAGACLDAIDPEPATPSNSPLVSLPNVILSAHRAGASNTVYSEIGKLNVAQVYRVMRGEWPLNFVNPDVKEKYTQKWKKSA